VVVGGAVVVVLVVVEVVVVVAHWWLSRIEPGGQHTSSARHRHVGGQHSLSQQVAPPVQHSGPQEIPVQHWLGGACPLQDCGRVQGAPWQQRCVVGV
jgi:hypothetical protein